MSGIIKAIMVTFVIMILIVTGFSASAVRPAFTGIKCPPAVEGATGAVTGRVTASMNTTGIVGAYVAVVNASNESEEYFNTTSGPDGYYQILGINASYNATDPSVVGPNGPTPYKIYANTSYGEGYSAAFGIDSSGGPSSPAIGVSPITATATPTPEPSPVNVTTPAITPSPTVAPAVSITSTPTATPAPIPGLVPAVLPLLLAVYIAIGASRRKEK